MIINEKAYGENSLNSTSAGKQPSQEILFEEKKVIPNKTLKGTLISVALKEFILTSCFMWPHHYLECHSVVV